MSEKTETIKREIEGLEQRLHNLHAKIDEAAANSDVDAIQKLQAEVAAVKTVLESARRRLDAAKVELSVAERADRKRANLRAVETIAKSLQRDVGYAEKIGDSLKTLCALIREMQEHAKVARAAVGDLTAQIPPHMQQTYWHVAQVVGNTDADLALALESLMQKEGLFTILAPSGNLHPQRFDLPPIRDFYEARAERLTRRVQGLADWANASLEEKS